VNYPLLLLHLINSPSLDPSIRVAGAIAFKNFIKRNWAIEEDVPTKIQEEDRQAIKREIVDLMLKSPENIQRQLSDAISVIGRHDFPANWPTLMHDLVQKLQTEDFHVINGVLRTAHSLFKRYRFEFKSDKLWSEIKLVLEQFAGPLTQLFLVSVLCFCYVVFN
jgi:exportin-2 (importin alpha re-exporter)